MSTLTDQAADNDILLKKGPVMDTLTVLRANPSNPVLPIALLPAATSANGQQTHDARVADG